MPNWLWLPIGIVLGYVVTFCVLMGHFWWTITREKQITRRLIREYERERPEMLN